ncbi:MAG: inorganic phosphate transporter [Desulfobacteraceae bacterium]|jgi:PiT family inorganic phosphate transporter|nr:MAG: inorganic phosphate transporter [Desulfobacteraceae bacterium]
MPDISLGLVVVLLLILGAEFVNGWTDAPNAIATVVSTRALSPRQAIVMAAVLNLMGVLSGTAVASTIGKGIIDAKAVDLLTVGGAMVGLILWSSIAARWGLPTSETHALVAGLAGAGIATAGPDVLVWAGWQKVLLGLVFSTFLGFAGGFLVMTLVYRLFSRTVPGKVRGHFRWLQVCSSAFMAFTHGSNDGQKFMGVFTMALVMGGVLQSFHIPVWVILLCAATMAFGTITGGWQIMRTMGMRVTKLQTHQGFSAEMAAASTIELASRLGIPLSTTHTISTSIMGVGATRRLTAVRWGVTAELVAAWVLTFPICGFTSWFVVKVFRMILG